MKNTILPLSVLASMALYGQAFAGTEMPSAKAVAPVTEEPVDWCEKIWSIPTLYKNDEAAFLNEFKIVGRYQLQYLNIDSNQGGYSDWETRRWRIGAEAKIFKDVKIAGQININPDFDPFYFNLDSAYIQFPVGPGKLTVGKHKPKFTYEYSTSSTKIVTFERSVLVNNLAPLKSTGATYAGEAGEFDYSIGLFSGDIDREFGGFNAGVFSLATIGKDLGWADWTFGYLYNGDSDGLAARDNHHSFSNTLVFGGEGPLKVGTDMIYSSGRDSDRYGIIILPTYDITEKIQAVARYQYAHGDNDGLRLGRARRVSNITDGGRGEDYHAVYAGLNYYICDHNLKLMTGIEYSDMDGGGDGGDFDGWTFFTGVRLYF